MIIMTVHNNDLDLPPLPEFPEELQSADAEGSWVRKEERDVSWLRFDICICICICILVFGVIIN